MRKDKEIAFQMRRTGKSYKEIRNALKIPISTLSNWFSELDWSNEMRKRLSARARVEHTARIVELDRIRGQHLKRVYEEAQKEAHEDLEKLKYNPLFIAGLMLYWGEGDKVTKESVKLINTDPMLIRLFSLFLVDACKIPIEKIKAHVLVYPDLDEEVCRSYWSEQSGVSLNRFIKSTLIQGRHKTKRLPYGVCTVYVSSTYFKVKIKEWLDIFPRELMNREYYENM